MFSATLEAIHSTASKRTAYTRGILAVLAITVIAKAVWFSRLGFGYGRQLVDFDAFYITALQVWQGSLDQAYDFIKLVDMQRAASGGHDGFMPWTYPPQFSLLVAPLALIPVGIGYLLFTASTLTLYLAVLRRVAGNYFVLVLIVFVPTILITLGCGQNGFLTGALIGLVCLFFEERPVLAGAALGLMIIKPHLAVAFALYAVVRRAWTVVITAGLVVLVSSVICTAVFGTQIWAAFLHSVRDSSSFLEQAAYPLYRMISVYAALRTSGLSAWAAFLGQGIVATLALGVVLVAAYRKMPVRESLGLTAIVTVCISPYMYAYDFPIFGVGLALLLPTLLTAARPFERAVIYAAPVLIVTVGHLRAVQLEGSAAADPQQYLTELSIGAFLIVPLIALIVRILLRSPISEAAQTIPANGPLARV